MPDEIMTPVSKPEAVAMAEIHALRQISDALTATNQSLHSLAHDVREVRGDVKEVREKVIRMEGEDLKAQLREMRADYREMLNGLIRRVDDLEGTRDQHRGAKGLIDWLRQTAPWIVAMFMALAAGVGFKTGGAAL